MKTANYGPVYAAALYPDLAEITRSLGWALAVHGSLARDFDLVCIPWVDEPAKPDDVLSRICSEFAIEVVGETGQKKHGRVAHSISIGHGECQLDISFMPTLENA